MRGLRSFPVTPIEGVERYLGEIETLDASCIDIDFVGIRSCDIERRDPAARTKVMLRRVSIESVGRQVFPRREQTKLVARDDPVKIALLRADRAVAFAEAIGRTLDLVRDASAMASAAHRSRRFAVIRHENKSGLVGRYPQRHARARLGRKYRVGGDWCRGRKRFQVHNYKPGPR
jgi:hypothetical protein